MFKKTMTICLLLFAVSAFATEINTAIPQKKWYQIDLIVFTQMTQQSMHTESWVNELLQPNLTKTLELAPAEDLSVTSLNDTGKYILLPSNQIGLQSEIKALQKNNNYQIVLHTTWIQSEDTFKHAKWIHLFGGQAFDGDGQPIKTTLQMGQMTNDDLSIDNPILTPAFWELNGKIKITLNRYFDIYSNLYLTVRDDFAQNSIDNENFIPLRSFSLKQHQRTRKNQLNYIDHPLFGLLIKISEYKSPLPILEPGPMLELDSTATPEH